jgi:2-oxoglutarate ferredoxin oxidoreductase subunit gamma
MVISGSEYLLLTSSAVLSDVMEEKQMNAKGVGKMWQISLSGAGEQDLVLAGNILAEAALLEGKEAVQKKSYGSMNMNGSRKSEVIISEKAIDCRVLFSDVLLAMSQEACHEYIGILKPGGQLIVDTTMVRTVPANGSHILMVPITQAACDQAGDGNVANIVALGALAGVTDAVSYGSLQKAVVNLASKGNEAISLKALEIGFNLASK